MTVFVCVACVAKLAVIVGRQRAFSLFIATNSTSLLLEVGHFNVFFFVLSFVFGHLQFVIINYYLRQ